MYLRSVELINWRSYRHARFEFPRPKDGKNVILVMAPNEHGKTSFFEAIALGLFGREGLSLVPRARTVSEENAVERLKASYSQFLSKTLHHKATISGPASCVVTIEVEDSNDEPIEITRTWHFRKDRTHKPGDDDLMIYYGIGREPVLPPVNCENRDKWYRDWIAQQFVHASLAEFFLFDGEQVQRYANREMSEQVRRGIEGLLGLPILRSLQSSLDRYAQNRRSATAAPSDSTVKSVELDIAKIEEEISEKKRTLDEALSVLPTLINESDELTQSIGGSGEGTTAMVGKLMQSEQRYRDEASRTMQTLSDLMAGDLALGIAGADLRKSTLNQLDAEAKRERWETGRNEGNQNLDRFKSDLSMRIKHLSPPLGEESQHAVVEAAIDSWDALWHPPPEGIAGEYLHPSLTGAMRAQAIERLSTVDNHSDSEIAGYAQRFQSAVEQADAMKREWQELETTAPETEKLTARLKELSGQIGRYEQRKQDAENAISNLQGDLASKRAELGRYISKIGACAPDLKRAEHADAYSRLIGELLNDALPSEVSEVAEEMTKAWKAMAHMPERIDHIEITPECTVRMVTKDGSDIHEIDKSAGGSQVFTQALITAITKVSGRAFPFIVDTPIARLSRQQRLGVLKTFTDRLGQVILLSTDEEVVGDKLDAIRHRVAAGFELKVRVEDGVAVSTVHPLDLEGV